MSPSRVKQTAWSLIAVGALTGAGLLQQPIDRRIEREDLVLPGNVVAQNHPQIKLLTNVFGGFRSVILATLWVRATKAHQEGNHYDALQLARLICELEPYDPGVWDYQSWQMAWNISVTKRTGEERWRWVSNGMKLLRDEGIAINPRSLILHKSLGWIFMDKMGSDTDEQHRYYKARWAYLMQRVLGAPPLGETKVVADAFRPIAQAPLDRTRRRQGLRDAGVMILQADQLASLAAGDKGVQACLDRLAQAGWNPRDEKGRLTAPAAYALLDAYAELSDDDAAAPARFEVIVPEAKRATPMYKALNDPALAAGRGKLLAFLRAQLLWNEFKLDPQIMLRMMEETYRCPLEWRAPYAHGLYWADLGIAGGHDIQAPEDNSTDWLNTARTELTCLKNMALGYGRLFYTYNPADPENPRLQWLPDPRVIEVVHRKMTERAWESYRIDMAEYKANKVTVTRDEAHGFALNKLRDGHVNFLIDAVMTLCAYGWQDEAQHYYDELRRLYDPDKNLYVVGLAQFFDERFKNPSVDTTRSQLTGCLAGGFYSLTYDAKASHYRDARQWAQIIWDRFRAGASERVQFAPGLEVNAGAVLGGLLAEPRNYGFVIPLWQRGEIYKQVGRLWPTVTDPTAARKVAYSPPCYAYSLLLASRAGLSRLAERENLTFDELFPKPEGYEAAMEELRELDRSRDAETPGPG
ncbi:MAG: hypothetical protein NTV86_22260 [Planctomycetota bacterium]|nr:hypothetical protein [Planctomycetota bacterium]